MSNDLMMRMKDQVLLVLADYQTCKLEHEVYLDRETERVSSEIAKRVMSNYAILAKKKESEPYMDEARTEIEAVVAEGAKLKRDPWAVCRHESTRICAAYAISRIIEAKAGKKHKFSVWSATVYTGSKALKGFKRGDHHGVSLLIAAPSKKKGVEMVNNLIGGHETVSWANDHWSGGGTIGDKVATKIGIWAAKDAHRTEDDYKLVWEPKP